MKNIYKFFLLTLVVFAVGCENTENSRFTSNPEFGWVQFRSASTTVAVTPRSSTVTIPIAYTAPINKNNVTVNYSVVATSGVNTGVTTSLGTSLVIGANTNFATFTFDFLPGAVQSLIDNGDLTLEVTLTSASNGVQVGLSDGSVPVVHTINLLCGGEPQPGVYTVDMFDSYGDGWQTDDGNGGSGMTVTMTNIDGTETVAEVGMCSPYGSAAGSFLGGSDCTGPAGFTFFSATTTVTMPNGTIDAVWEFPGDFWGEISFDIYLPSGGLLYDSGAPGAQADGELAVSYCI